ncbi:MAG: hypothetical protein ACTSSK_11245 [Candidatus Heimdallarchaeota archaeon]
MDEVKTKLFYKITLTIALCGIIGYFLQDIFTTLVLFAWATQSFYFIFLIFTPISSLFAVIAIVIIIRSLYDQNNPMKTKRIALIFALLSGLIHFSNYTFTPLIIDYFYESVDETFLSLYQMFEINFFAAAALCIAIMIPFILQLIYSRKDEAKYEKLAFIPPLILLVVYDFISEHITRELLFKYWNFETGFLFIPKLFEIIFSIIIILVIVFDLIIKNKKIMFIGKSILTCIFLIITTIMTTIAIRYFFFAFQFIFAILGSICLIIGSIMLIIATILVIIMKVKEKPQKHVNLIIVNAEVISEKDESEIQI